MIDTAAETHAKTWSFKNRIEVDLTLEKIAKINSRAVRLGLEGSWTYAVSEREVTSKNDLGWETTYTVWDMVVDGIVPSYAGWAFIATIEWDEQMGFTTRPMPGFEGVIDRATLVQGYCDHCKTNRYRNRTFLLEGANGERVQVGSSCIKDFLGHDFSAAYLPEASDLDEIEGGFYGGVVRDRYNVVEVLTLAITATRVHGWVARSAYTGTPTSSRVLDVLNPPRGNTKGAQEMRDAAAALVASVTDADRAKVEVVREWIAAQPISGEYIQNLQSASAVETIPSNMLGVLVSGPGAYDKAMGKIVERAAAQVSEFVGQAGDKIQAEVEVKHLRYIEGEWGTTTLVTFVTPEGNLIKWFQSASSQAEFAIGDKATIKATVKKTEVFNDVKATVVLRVKKVG